MRISEDTFVATVTIFLFIHTSFNIWYRCQQTENFDEQDDDSYRVKNRMRRNEDLLLPRWRKTD